MLSLPFKYHGRAVNALSAFARHSHILSEMRDGQTSQFPLKIVFTTSLFRGCVSQSNSSFKRAGELALQVRRSTMSRKPLMLWLQSCSGSIALGARRLPVHLRQPSTLVAHVARRNFQSREPQGSLIVRLGCNTTRQIKDEGETSNPNPITSLYPTTSVSR